MERLFGTCNDRPPRVSRVCKKVVNKACRNGGYMTLECEKRAKKAQNVILHQSADGIDTPGDLRHSCSIGLQDSWLVLIPICITLFPRTILYE